MIPLRYPTPTPPRPTAPSAPPRPPRGGDYVDLENLDRPELDDEHVPAAPLLPLDWEDGEGESGVKQVTKRA